MCRWVAYAGPEICLEDLIFHQEHSIVNQSLAANHSAWVTNGDGFGVAWYTKRTTPGLFKDILPAWNDSNLRSLSAHIQTSGSNLTFESCGGFPLGLLCANLAHAHGNIHYCFARRSSATCGFGQGP